MARLRFCSMLDGLGAPCLSTKVRPPMFQTSQQTAPSYGAFLKTRPILGTLGILTFLNWFVFFGVGMYLHGDALGTLPSRDGFVLSSHGHHTPVSESVWLFSLIYSRAT